MYGSLLRGLFAFLAFVTFTTPAIAKQWKVTLKKVAVAPVKNTGEPWDGDGSGPDVVGHFGVGRVDGDKCLAEKN